jgi:hypothetical protein
MMTTSRLDGINFTVLAHVHVRSMSFKTCTEVLATQSNMTKKSDIGRFINKNRDSPVRIVTAYELDGQSLIPNNVRFFFFP